MPTSPRICSIPTSRNPSRLNRTRAASISRRRVLVAAMFGSPHRCTGGPPQVYIESTPLPANPGIKTNLSVFHRSRGHKQHLHPRRPIVVRYAYFAFGIACHVMFLGVFAYMACFVG